jgi:hypothetical protein
MVEEILSDAGRPSGDSTKVKLAIVAAVDRHRDQSFFFNERTFEFPTVDGQSAYGEADSGFPRGLIHVIGELTLLVAQDSTSPTTLPRIAFEKMQDLRALQAATEAQPEAWSYFNRKIELYPTPDATVHTITGAALVDVGTITKRYNSATSAWEFFQPWEPAVAMTDDYPSAAQDNAWFREGYELIKAYALTVLYGEKLHTQDGRLESARIRYLEALDALQSRGNRLTAPMYIEPMRF